MVSERDVLPVWHEREQSVGERMKFGRGWTKALAIWTALALTGCGTAPGDSPGQMAKEASVEEPTESLTGAWGDAAGKGNQEASEESQEEASQEAADGKAQGTSPEEPETDEGDSQEAGMGLTFSLGGDASTIGLPQEILEQVAAINAGEPPASAVGMEELEGYYALIATHTIIGKDAETGEEVTGRGELTFYVPNLLEGLADVSALFYDRAAEQWEVLPVEQDIEAKTVSVMLSGSGILTVIYSRQE